jgi:hypothetical protein
MQLQVQPSEEYEAISLGLSDTALKAEAEAPHNDQ